MTKHPIAIHNKANNPNRITKISMESLLKHLVELTCHRDHTLLDISVISALQELIGVHQARVLEVYKSHDVSHLRQRAWIRDGKVVTSGDDSEVEQPGRPLLDYPVLMRCVEQHTISVTDPQADGTYTLWVPIWQNDRLVSCLEICTRTRLTTNVHHTLDGILRVYQNFQNLLDYSERDSLTGLLNRKTFDENFSRMISAATHVDGEPGDGQERRGHPEHKEQWLAVIDIDHFKRVNDHFGHVYGDEVLLLVANILRSSFRSQDRIFRFGGEEFVVLLRSTTLADAHHVFSRFRSNIEKYPFPQVGQITVSLGFASISQQTPVVILGQADQALYYGKTHGRNQVCHYEELVERGELETQVSNSDVEFF